MKQRQQQFINGQWLSGDGKEMLSSNPATGASVWKGNAATVSQVRLCAQSAVSASEAWMAMSTDDRIAYLNRFVETVKARQLDLATAISSEIGKPLWESTTEVAAVIGKLAPTIEAFKQRDTSLSRAFSESAEVRTRFKAHGVVAILGPYNFPAHIPNGHILPALLAGNAVIFKPSEKSPLVGELIAECWERAGVPAGIFNLLQGGPEVGAALCQSENVQGVFFTGSREVGKKINDLCGLRKICALEMGGNSPLVVWDSSDIDAAVVATIQSAFITTGQRCSAARRLIVNRSTFADNFLKRLVQVTSQLRIAPFTKSPEPYMGPLRNQEMVDHILQKQQELRCSGASILLHGQRLEMGSSFISPSIIDVTQVNDRSDEEIFGPLLQVIRVDSFDAAITEANNTAFGLAAGLISEDASLYQLFEKKIRAGIVNWNQQLTGASPWAPFGGIKDSGNWRPSAFLAVDYCGYSTGSVEAKNTVLPKALPPGLLLN